jgi:hypothetical protein
MSEDWRAWTVGTRVVVRRRLVDAERTAGAADHLFTDVIGVVQSVDDDGVTLRPDPARRDARRGGTEPVRVAAADVVGAKRVPPRPERARRRG